MKTRLTFLAIIVLGWLILAWLLSDFSPLQVAYITATPTRTPKSTFTATATATTTPRPSSTPTPTDRPTTTPVPTSTPLPTSTDTPTPPPTDTETPTPTITPSATPQPTPRPTSRPTNTPLPRPTNTPAPPFTGRIIRGHTHCGGYAGVTGLVKHPSGDAYAGVAVGVWSAAWEGRVSVTEANGKYELSLTDIPPGMFKVAVVRLETCSQQDGRLTAKNCQVISNAVDNVMTTAHCQGDGANQVTEIEFVGP